MISVEPSLTAQHLVHLQTHRVTAEELLAVVPPIQPPSSPPLSTTRRFLAAMKTSRRTRSLQPSPSQPRAVRKRKRPSHDLPANVPLKNFVLLKEENRKLRDEVTRLLQDLDLVLPFPSLSLSHSFSNVNSSIFESPTTSTTKTVTTALVHQEDDASSSDLLP